MAQRVNHRRQLTYNFVASSKDSQELGLGALYRELYLTLNMTVTAAAGAAITNANTRPGDEWGVIKNIRLIQNGSDVIRQFTGEQLRWLNIFYYTVPPRSPLAPGVAVSTSLTINSTLALPLWSVNTNRRIDTLLDARNLSRLELEIEWGTIADVSSAASASFTGTPQLIVSSLESSGIEGNFSRSSVTRLVEQGVGVNDSFQKRLNVAGEMYTSLLINSKDANGDDDPDTLDNIILKSGTNEFYNVPGNTVQDLTWLRKGIRVTHDDAGGAEDGFFASSNSNKDAWYHVNLITDGFITEGLDTLGMAELILELDVNQTINTLTILPLTITPIRSK